MSRGNKTIGQKDLTRILSGRHRLPLTFRRISAKIGIRREPTSADIWRMKVVLLNNLTLMQRRPRQPIGGNKMAQLSGQRSWGRLTPAARSAGALLSVAGR